MRRKLGAISLLVTAASVALVASHSTRGFAGPNASSAPTDAPSAGPKAPAASASVAPSASASASAPADEEAVPLASLTIPTDKSPFPKNDEWKQAKTVTLARHVPAASRCTVLLLREYAKVWCAIPIMAVRQFAGPVEDVGVWLTPKNDVNDVFRDPTGGYVIFPLRKGSGYVFRFFGADSGYDGGAFPADGPIVDAYWPNADAAPTVTIR